MRRVFPFCLFFCPLFYPFFSFLLCPFLSSLLYPFFSSLLCPFFSFLLYPFFSFLLCSLFSPLLCPFLSSLLYPFFSPFFSCRLFLFLFFSGFFPIILAGRTQKPLRPFQPSFGILYRITVGFGFFFEEFASACRNFHVFFYVFSGTISGLFRSIRFFRELHPALRFPDFQGFLVGFAFLFPYLGSKPVFRKSLFHSCSHCIADFLFPAEADLCFSRVHVYVHFLRVEGEGEHSYRVTSFWNFRIVALADGCVYGF